MLYDSAVPACLAIALVLSPFISAHAQQPSIAVSAAAPPPSRPDDQNHTWNSPGDRVLVENYTLQRLIRTAYGLKSDSQVLSGPDWIGKQAFDIEAKFGDVEIAKMQNLSGRERFHEAQLALQALLADRFQLKSSQETRTIPVYVLVVAKTGAKLAPAAPQLDKDGKAKTDKNHTLNERDGHMTAIAISMGGLADWFVYQPECDRVVIDRTGLTGDYDFKLDWAVDHGEGPAADSPYPGLFTALREQLGLELKADKAPVGVVVVKSASEPSLD
jgi:uncharacterized protein (TIGR03435 family)